MKVEAIKPVKPKKDNNTSDKREGFPFQQTKGI